MYRRVVSKLLFRLPPEVAHRLALTGLRVGLSIPGIGDMISRPAMPEEGMHEVDALGLRFSCPVGLAAGFDKNGRCVDMMEKLGFGFVEVGSVTARPWGGNPSPRLFRLPRDGALINRMGLNNEGADAIAARLGRVRKRVDIPILVNVAKTPAPELDALEAGVADYVEAVTKLAPVADAIVLNVSCPNTGDGRTFEDPAALDVLLGEVRGTLAGRPLLVKVSGDLEGPVLDTAMSVAMRHGVDGIVAINTSVSREGLTQTSPADVQAIGAGGVSGPPIFHRAIATVTRIRKCVGPELVVIGVGGVTSAAEVHAMRLAGATLVEIYTGFVYGGPATVADLVPGWSGEMRPAKAGEPAIARPPARVARSRG